MNKCLVPECKRGLYSRGLCNAHYLVASRLIRKGDTTWAELEHTGKALPARTSHDVPNKTQDWFLKRGK